MRDTHLFFRLLILLTGLLVGVSMASVARAQSVESAAPDAQESMVLTLDQAVEIALENNLDLQSAQLDRREADAQVQEAWGQLYPSINLTGSYTRNVVTANPFAGSDVTSFLGGSNETDWVAFNERRRLGDDPNSRPVTFPEFQQMQRDSLAAAGVSLGGGGNPFGVDNEFIGGIQLTQTLYNRSAFTSVQGAQQAKDVSRHAQDRQVQVVTNEVVQGFYEVLLANERVRIRQQRVRRAQETLQEVSSRVARGTLPKAQRLGAEVELSNARTQRIEAQNAVELARDQLKETLGISAQTPIEVDGSLEQHETDGLQTISLETVSMTRAVDMALDNRPDLKRAQLNVELREIQKEASKAEYLPQVEAVANFNYSGRVPDDRSQVLTTDPNDPTNPFYFDERNRQFFSDDFWNPSFSVGLQLSWNIFNGFQTSARVEQAEVQYRRAETQHERLRRAIKLEVRGAIRNLENARERIQTQETTVRQAELNYDHMTRRVSEGVASQIELREASEQLDQSRLNYLQALYDYLIARSDLETALGQPLTPASESYLMTRR